MDEFFRQRRQLLRSEIKTINSSGATSLCNYQIQLILRVMNLNEATERNNRVHTQFFHFIIIMVVFMLDWYLHQTTRICV